MGFKAIEFLFVTLAALGASYVKEALDSHGPYISLTMASLAAVIIILLLSGGWLILRWYFGMDPKFKFLGTWCDALDHPDGRLITTNQIRYSILQDAFFLEGFAYIDDQLVPHSTWGSSVVTFPEPHIIVAIHHSKIFNSEQPDITGITRMRFNGGGDKYFEGMGDLVDNSSPPLKMDFWFRRVTTEELETFIGKKKIQSSEDRRRFVQSISRTFSSDSTQKIAAE